MNCCLLFLITFINCSFGSVTTYTVLPAKSDSDAMFCLYRYQGLRIRIGLIHKWSIDSRQLKWSVQVTVLFKNCKQNVTSLSLLVGTTVVVFSAVDP